MSEDRTLHILNLGCGVQSTALYLMSLRRDEPEHVPVFDYAIFADTQEEPDEVYRHLGWLEGLDGPPILHRTFGKLGDDLIRGHHMVRRKETAKYRPGQEVAKCYQVPSYIRNPDGSLGMVQRQCTDAYKINVIERTIREEIVGLARGNKFPAGVTVYQHFGLSHDEPSRVVKAQAKARSGLYNPRFPLFDLEWSRRDCLDYLKGLVPHQTPRSACSFCPYHKDSEWRRIRDTDPGAWERACEIDEGLRRPGAACAGDLVGIQYLHRSCTPLREARIDSRDDLPGQRLLSFASECTGMCGL